MAYAAGSMRQVLLRASAKVAVSALGAVLVAAGIALLFLPGPGILVLLAGVALLAREYLWARRLRDRLSARADELRRRARRHRQASTRMVGPPASPADTAGPLDDVARHDHPRARPERDDVSAV